ncbi:hypothetical protein NC651_032901 [Populus alba x Populus x berolinensis]|nr:hypothetical protein NC651_032901 [Populus alba x Populus x berolinensis]
MSCKSRIWMQLREVLESFDPLVFKLSVICNVFS